MSSIGSFNLPLPSGFRDFLPEDMIVRQWMFDSIRGVFERFGYRPLDTPCVERREILTGKDPAFSMRIFSVILGGRGEYALRYDLTVPLARVIATPAYRNDIQLPSVAIRPERSSAARRNNLGGSKSSRSSTPTSSVLLTCARMPRSSH